MAVVSTIALVDSRRTHIRSWCSALEGVEGGLADAAQGGPALGDGLAGGCVCLTNQDASPFLQGILVRALCTELQGHRLHMHPHKRFSGSFLCVASRRGPATNGRKRGMACAARQDLSSFE